ncbi:hypothetical protein ACWEQE_49070, partial [Streptomyces sp. NPDC004270]
MSLDLTPVIAASTRWLLAAYPAPGGALSRALAEAQARQAVTLAATLRYPTPAVCGGSPIPGSGTPKPRRCCAILTCSRTSP